MFDVGKLRHRITIRRPIEMKTASGGYTTTWSDFATVSAMVTGVDGHESVIGQALQGISVYRITIRHRADILESDQLRGIDDCFRGRDLNIRSISDPDGMRQQLVIIADTASARNG